MPIDFEVTMNEYLPLRDVVFNTLRRAILRGELKPGERLMEIQLANKLGVSRTPIREAIRKLELGDLRMIAGAMGNVLEEVTIPMHPEIDKIKQEMKAAGALGAMMSGSGPTVFGLFESRAAARTAQRNIREKELTRQVYVTNIHSVRRNHNAD